MMVVHNDICSDAVSESRQCNSLLNWTFSSGLFLPLTGSMSGTAVTDKQIFKGVVIVGVEVRVMHVHPIPQ